MRSRDHEVKADGVGSTAVNGDNNAPIVTTIIQPAFGRRTRLLVWAGGTLVVLLSLISLAAWGALIVSPASSSPGPARSVPPSGRPAGAYVAYEKITDQTGVISLEVPREWSSRLFNGWHPSMSPYVRDVKVGPGLNASVNTSDWFEHETPVPGVFAGASSRMVKDGITLDRLSSVFAPRRCTTDGPGPYAIGRLGLAGLDTKWTCAGGTGWRTLDLQDAARTYLVSLQVRTVGARDDAAFEHIARTLRITGSP